MYTIRMLAERQSGPLLAGQAKRVSKKDIKSRRWSSFAPLGLPLILNPLESGAAESVGEESMMPVIAHH